MKEYFTQLFNSNYFFLSLLLFVFSLPLSVALVSVAAAIVFLAALLEDSWEAKMKRFKSRRVLLWIPFIFFLYLASTLVSLKADQSFYDVKKTLFYLVIPLAFCFGKDINRAQKRAILWTFSVGIFIAIGIALWRWRFMSFEGGNFPIHEISLISHIRFSFQLILGLWFLVLLLISNAQIFCFRKEMLIVILGIVFLGFLVLQQSLTGLLAFGASCVFFFVYRFRKINMEWKIPLALILLLLVAVPVIYVRAVVQKFYTIEEVDQHSIDMKTALGNAYTHDFNNKLVENGHYVYLYVCEPEMRVEWDKRSECKYDSIGANGYPISATLIRYLTSKGLRKDAEGVKALTAADIKNVEGGISNVIFAQKYSLYPRIYQTVWEYYVYSETGYSNNQSFSQRIEFAKAALTIIQENLWSGVGTAHWRQAFADAFKKNNAKLDEDHYASAHNQYLNYAVKFGVPGLLLILFALVYPVIKTKRFEDPLFMLFLVFMFLANFADSNLESHMGSSFFFFFYCFFLTGPLDYLSQKSQTEDSKNI